MHQEQLFDRDCTTTCPKWPLRTFRLKGLNFLGILKSCSRYRWPIFFHQKHDSLIHCFGLCKFQKHQMRALSFASADTVGGNFSMLLILAAALQCKKIVQMLLILILKENWINMLSIRVSNNVQMVYFPSHLINLAIFTFSNISWQNHWTFQALI